jgi:hypothetical protein
LGDSGRRNDRLEPKFLEPAGRTARSDCVRNPANGIVDWIGGELRRRLTKNTRDHHGRAWLARLMAFVFVLQSIGLFLAPARPASAEMGAEMAGASAMAMPDCPHHHAQGKGGGHGSSDSCPMCQMLGCALAGAPLPALVAGVNERLLVILSIPATSLSPRAPPLQSPPPRGPPILV